jgi:ankyrin repeat protein
MAKSVSEVVVRSRNISDAIIGDNLNDVRYFLGRGFDINGRVSEVSHLTVLNCAIFGDKVNIVQELLNRGADVNQADSLGMTPLHMVVINANIAILQMILAKEADIDKVTTRGDSPLVLAVERENIEIVRILLDHGADVNKVSLNIAKVPAIKELIHEKQREVARWSLLRSAWSGAVVRGIFKAHALDAVVDGLPATAAGTTAATEVSPSIDTRARKL